MTYDSGVTSFFNHNNVDDNHHPSRQLQYVGVLKDILQLDYGTMSTPIVLFRCDWVRNASNNRGNPTYKRDDAGFLMANFRHMLLEDIEPLYSLPKCNKFFMLMTDTPHGGRSYYMRNHGVGMYFLTPMGST